MRKIVILTLGLLLFLMVALVKNVFASDAIQLDAVQDINNTSTCTSQKYDFKVDEDNTTHLDFSQTGGKVDIIFNDTDGTPPSHNDENQIIVTAGAGYEIVNIQYELEHYSGIGWVTIPGTNPTTTVTLAGVDDDSRIDEVQARVKTVCPTITPTVIQTTPTPSENNSSTTPANTPQCSDRNTTNTPANLQVSRNGDKATVSFFMTEGDTADVLYKEISASDWQYSVTGLTPNTDKFVSTEIGGLNTNTEYTFGARQRFGCGGGDIVTTGSGISEAQVLGASTMAGTGTFEEKLMNLYAIFGMLLILGGYLSLTKEKRHSSSI